MTLLVFVTSSQTTSSQGKVMRNMLTVTALAVLASVSYAADPKGTVPTLAPTAAPTIASITGNPLRVNVGSDHTFQIINSAIPGTGQIYPSNATGSADMGWFVRVGATKYAPDFSQHPSGTATGNIGTNTAWTPGSISAVSGAGTAANPFKVTVTNGLPTLNLNSSQEVSYVNGDNFFRKKFTLSNTSAAAITAVVFLGADIYLAGSDSGIPQLVSGSPGGKDCTAGTYNILMIPQGTIAPTGYSAKAYSTVWSEIGAGALSNQVTAGCQDNGAALQWNISVPAGGSTTVEAVTSFGAIPTVIIPPVIGPPVEVPLLAPLGVLLLGLCVGVVGVIRRRSR
jgi:hypothetical protein